MTLLAASFNGAVFRRHTATIRCSALLSRKAAAVLAFAAMVSLAPMGEAVAQSSEIRSLTQRIERLQGELNDLQRHVYSGGGPTSTGESAVQIPAEGDNQIARLHLNLQRLERDIQELTGRLEELDHQVRQAASQVETMNQDMDLRFSDLEARIAALETGGASGAEEPAAGAAAGAGATAGGAAGMAADSGEEMELVPGREPRSLGTVPADDVAALREGRLPGDVQSGGPQAGSPQSGEAATQGTPSGGGEQEVAAGAAGGAAATAEEIRLPDGTAQEQYQYAFGLLRQARYAEAEMALEQFLEANPEDALAGNAKYWLGETHYVRGDYREAAVAFAEGFQDYPDSEKAPDNLLKLGLSLAQLDRAEDACAALDEVLAGYPNAPSNIRDRAERERGRIGC